MEVAASWHLLRGASACGGQTEGLWMCLYVCARAYIYRRMHVYVPLCACVCTCI